MCPRLKLDVGRHHENQVAVKIRFSTDADRAAIFGVHNSAFGAAQGSEIVELVSGLLNDKTAIPVFSLVAETDERVVGHILFSTVRIQSGCHAACALILAPLAVSKEHQGRGIGSLLIKEGLKELAASGVGLVFVLGDPNFYRKFGFRPAGVLGYEAPYAILIEHADAWMVQELKAGILGRAQGRVQCAKALDHPRHWRE